MEANSSITGPGSFPDLWRTHLERLALGRHAGPATQIGAALRASATRYCAEAGLSGDDALAAVVRALCGTKPLYGRTESWFDPPPEWWPHEGHIEQGALVAATIFNNAVVAEQLLARRRGAAIMEEEPGVRSHFNNPAYLALYYGSRDVVRVFKRMSRGEGEDYYFSNIVDACADSGSAEDLEALWGEAPLEPLDVGSPDLPSTITREALLSQSLTGNPDMIELYRKLSFESRGFSAPALLKDTPESERYNTTQSFPYTIRELVERASSRGHIRMLEYLLEVVFPLNQCPRNLSVAATAGAFQTEAVEWLLGHGASVTKGRPLEEAVCAGSFEITKMLIENGADVHAGYVPPIACAVRIEHAGIVDLLVKNGALTRKGREKALKVADGHGLDSMAELIHSYSKKARRARARQAAKRS